MKRALKTTATALILTIAVAAGPISAAERRSTQRSVRGTTVTFFELNRFGFLDRLRAWFRLLESPASTSSVRPREDPVRRGGQEREVPSSFSRPNSFLREIDRSRTRFRVMPEVE